MELDPQALSGQENYKLLLGAVVPRPIAWVSTLSPEGERNLAPFSYFNIACANPPTLLFCPNRRAGGAKKDTLRNIEALGEYVIHIVSEELAEQMNQTSADYDYGVDEFEQAGLSTLPSRLVRPQRLAAAPIAFECRLLQIVTVSELAQGGEVVLGRVVWAHVRDELYQQGRIDLAGLRPIGRLAGAGYTRVSDTFELARPSAPPDNV